MYMYTYMYMYVCMYIYIYIYIMSCSQWSARAYFLGPGSDRLYEA